jgi:hypothetical protein
MFHLLLSIPCTKLWFDLALWLFPLSGQTQAAKRIAQTEAAKKLKEGPLKICAKLNYIPTTICFYVMLYISGWNFGNKNLLNKSMWEESVCLKK